MKVDVDSCEYVVDFEYGKREIELGEGSFEVRYTCCTILGEQLALVGVGVSDCSPQDNFSKRVGRKLSFARALKSIPDHDVRKVFWAAFHKQWPYKQ